MCVYELLYIYRFSKVNAVLFCIRAKKVAYKAWLANKSSVELRSQYSEARKVAATEINLSKERAWKEFGERLDDDFKMANDVFWQTIRRLRGKRSQAVSSSKVQMESLWKIKMLF